MHADDCLLFLSRQHLLFGIKGLPLCTVVRKQANAVIAQLVEHWLPKPRVAGSSPVYRSTGKHPKGAFVAYMDEPHDLII